MVTVTRLKRKKKKVNNLIRSLWEMKRVEMIIKKILANKEYQYPATDKDRTPTEKYRKPTEIIKFWK